MSLRRARFTDRAVRNSAATSGSRTTAIAPLGNRLAYLLRTPLEKSYSARISGSRSRRLAFLLIRLTFAPGSASCTDEADRVASIGMDNDQQPPSSRSAD